MSGDRIVSVRVLPLDRPLRSAFEISGGALARARNVLVQVTLASGDVGWGEGAPLPAYDGQTPEDTLRWARSAGKRLIGRQASRRAEILRLLEKHCPGSCARAALEMAVLDAWARYRKVPLWVFFGGAGTRLSTAVTVPILPPVAAAEAARRIHRMGVRALKIKVGRDPETDRARVLAAWKAGRWKTLILDANGGFTPKEALRLLRLLKKDGVRPDLFEQPVPAKDMDGMAEVSRKTTVPVAADESARGPEDVLRLARRSAARCVNIKLMKSGPSGALEMARVARASGLSLMIGANVETRLAAACAAHLAAGFGGFNYIDLDTPLYFAREGMRGPGPGRGGVYDLSRVSAGIGVAPSVYP